MSSPAVLHTHSHAERERRSVARALRESEEVELAATEAEIKSVHEEIEQNHLRLSLAADEMQRSLSRASLVDGEPGPSPVPPVPSVGPLEYLPTFSFANNHSTGQAEHRGEGITRSQLLRLVQEGVVTNSTMICKDGMRRDGAPSQWRSFASLLHSPRSLEFELGLSKARGDGSDLQVLGMVPPTPPGAPSPATGASPAAAGLGLGGLGGRLAAYTSLTR